jgi:hypothetical protein
MFDARRHLPFIAIVARFEIVFVSFQDFSETLQRKTRRRVIEPSSILKWSPFILPLPSFIDNQVSSLKVI